MKHLIGALVFTIFIYSSLAENTEKVVPEKMLSENLQITVILKIATEEEAPEFSVTTSGSTFQISDFYKLGENVIIRVNINGMIVEIDDGKYHINHNIRLDKPIITKGSKGQQLEYCKTGANSNIFLKQGEIIEVSRSKDMSIYIKLSKINTNPVKQ